MEPEAGHLLHQVIVIRDVFLGMPDQVEGKAVRVRVGFAAAMPFDKSTQGVTGSHFDKDRVFFL